MPTTRSGFTTSNMSSDGTAGAGGGQPQGLTLEAGVLEELKLRTAVSKLLTRDGPFNGEKDRTKRFLALVDAVFNEYAGRIPERLQAGCVAMALGETVSQRWTTSSVQDPTLKDSWATMKPWFNQYRNPENPRLKAVTKLKKLHLNGDSLSSRVSEFEEACNKLDLNPGLRNLFFVAALDADVIPLVESLHGHEFETWDLHKLEERVLPLCQRENSRRRQQQQQQQPQQSQLRKQVAARPAGKEQPPATTQKHHEHFARLLAKLDPVELPGGSTYKPKDVAALKASLQNDANPDAAKLKTFLTKHGLCFVCRDKGHISSNCPGKSSDRAAAK